MKVIKKYLYVLLLLLLVIISGCSIEAKEPLTIAINSAKIELNENESVYEIVSDLTFINGEDNSYNYEWTSSNEKIISNTGEVNRSTEDSEVIITLTVYNSIEQSHKDFIFIVLKAESDGYTYDLKGVKSFLSVYDLNEVEEDGHYNNHLDLVAYIHIYHKLPSNYLTKSKAKSMGWNGSGSNVWVNSSLQGKYIGGDTFKNYEGYLPDVGTRIYVEVDVNCNGGARGKYRIVYNRDNFDIYYTDDHYSSFTYMIGEEK